MRTTKFLLTGFWALSMLLLVVSVSAGEKKIKKSDLPPAVQKTADEQSRGATVKGYSMEVENGQTEYEVELIVNGHSKDVSIDAQGNVIEVEEEVPLRSVPEAVHQGFMAQAPKGIITKVETITKNGKLVAYEAQVHNGEKRSEIRVGPDGKPLDHKE